MPISRRTAPHASEGKTRPAHHAGLGHVRLPADYTGSPYPGGPLSDDSSCGRHSPQRRGPALRPSWPSPASRQTAVSLAAPKTVLYRTGSKASANAGVSHSAYRRSGCQHRVGHGHGSLDCDSKTVRDRPPFSLHLHRIAWQSLAFCGQDMPVKGNVQLFWDTIKFHSVAEFAARLERFLQDYNTRHAHPYRWTYTGEPLVRDTPFSRTRRQQRHGRAFFSPRPKRFERLFYSPRPYRRQAA